MLQPARFNRFHQKPDKTTRLCFFTSKAKDSLAHYGLEENKPQDFQLVAKKPMAQHKHAITLNWYSSVLLLNTKHNYVSPEENSEFELGFQELRIYCFKEKEFHVISVTTTIEMKNMSWYAIKSITNWNATTNLSQSYWSCKGINKWEELKNTSPSTEVARKPFVGAFMVNTRTICLTETQIPALLHQDITK